MTIYDLPRLGPGDPCGKGVASLPKSWVPNSLPLGI
jgi:hypothetical protein